MPGSNGSSSIACSWNGSICSDGGGNCTPDTAPQPSNTGAAPTTSCEGASSGWPLFNNGSNYESKPQVCGNGYASGSLAIGGLITQTWTNYAPDGSGAGGEGSWTWYDGCSYVNDSNISVITTGSLTINPWSATATNWLAPIIGNSETRYWSSGALWGTGSEVSSADNSPPIGDWFWVNNQGWSSGLYSAELPMWTHGCSSTGTMVMSNYVQANVNNSTSNSAATMSLSYSASSRAANTTNRLLQGAVAPSISKQKGNFRIVEKQVKLPFNFAGGKIVRLGAQCPIGFMLMQSSVLSMGAVNNTKISHKPSGIEVSGTSDMAGMSLRSQVVCLKTGLGKILKGGHYWGTAGNDVMKGQVKGLFYFGGPGQDTITANGNSSQVFGGGGNDNIRVSGKDSVSVGGPGDDLLTAVGNFRIRLEGGHGKDKLFGGKGVSILDARDGRAGDHLTCSGTKNIALIDTGDIVKGKCAQIIRGTMAPE
jgi:hypothetical protein